jgi:hypothetical protein
MPVFLQQIGCRRLAFVSVGHVSNLICMPLRHAGSSERESPIIDRAQPSSIQQACN